MLATYLITIIIINLFKHFCDKIIIKINSTSAVDLRIFEQELPREESEITVPRRCTTHGVKGQVV